MIRFRNLTILSKNLLFKNTTKRFETTQRVLGESFVRNAEKDKDDYTKLPPKVSRIIKIASQKEVDLNEILVKPQSTEEAESIFKEIAQGDAEREKQLRLLLYEVSLKREEESDVPNVLTKKQWEDLLKLPNITSRNRYLSFLFKIEKKRESAKIKNLLRRKETETFKDVYQTNQHIYYGLGGDTMFMRIYPRTLQNVQDIRMCTNKLFTSPILFDCSYQEYMNDFTMKYCAKQIGLALQICRGHQYPCSLQLVNLKKGDLLVKYLNSFMRNIENDDTPVEVFEESYLDLYPRERIVYLTPHTKNDLVEYNENDIYVIGAYVDRGTGVQVSKAKAKESNVRMAKLPLDHFLLWKKGTKSLTLNNVLNILLDMRYYRNWKKALENIPSRNLKE